MPPSSDSTFFNSWSKEIALNFPTIFALDDDGRYYTEQKYLLDGIETKTILAWDISLASGDWMTLTLKLQKENRIYDLTLLGSGDSEPRFYLSSATVKIEERQRPVFPDIKLNTPQNFIPKQIGSISSGSSPIYLDTGYSSAFYSPEEIKMTDIGPYKPERKSQCDTCENKDDPTFCAFGCGEYDEDGEEEPCPGFCKKIIKEPKTERDIIL